MSKDAHYQEGAGKFICMQIHKDTHTPHTHRYQSVSDISALFVSKQHKHLDSGVVHYSFACQHGVELYELFHAFSDHMSTTGPMQSNNASSVLQ